MNQRLTKPDRGKLTNKRTRVEGGFTLVELMIAMTVLAIGMLSAMILMLMGMQGDSRNKSDTTATVLDQEVIELYSTLKTYPSPNHIIITDCALTGSNTHEADIGMTLGSGTTSLGATVYTSSTAPTNAQIGDIDWTAALPTLATPTQAGYAMEYQTCSGELYEVRWNITDLYPTPVTPPSGTAPTSRLSLLTVSARQKTAVTATNNNVGNAAVLFARPVTLRSLIEE